MNWSIVQLIFKRELCDQMRDRRTLFTVAIMPLLLYPLLGMALLQVAQFMREHPTDIWIVGAENLSVEPAFIIDGKIDTAWLDKGKEDLQTLHMSPEGDQYFFDLVQQFKGPEEQGEDQDAGELVDELIQREMRKRNIDLAVIIPAPPQDDELESGTGLSAESPAIYMFVNSASDKSNIAADRFNASLVRWQNALIAGDIEQAKAEVVAVAEPFQIKRADVADSGDKKAATWSKILPFIIMIWCLTGAFYPAVDLCAGEKERGTFETLLSSPAHRSDIAIGKLLTVMTFSVMTAVLNLVSMGFTGLFVFSRMGSLGMGPGMATAFGPPPLAAIGWLLLALIPISALFSAMALAAAAFARSSKEGQYYLIPLLMICMPLMMLPMLPAARLDIGSSLIPVTGLMLMLRGLIEGQYAEVLQFAGPVCVVTIVCCWLSIRWVVTQFNSETVLFRASERFGIGAWFRHVMRERGALPSLGAAVMCAMLILVLKFFIGFALTAPDSWAMFSKQTVIALVATVAMPAILMALVLTRKPRHALKIHRCSIPVACAAVLTAVLLHPFVMWIMALVMYVYPPAGDLVMMQQAVGMILGDAPNIWAILFVFALAPAVLEEVAYRGFILSGGEAMKNKWSAVIFASVMFGLAHGVFQQSIITFFVGIVLGWIAIRTGSILPCILYHGTHNGLTVMLSYITPATLAQSKWLSWIFEESGTAGMYQYSILPGILMTLAGFALLAWIVRTGGPDSIRRREESRKRGGGLDIGSFVDNLLSGKKKQATSEG
ncbi:MAG: ABC transporter permease subunit/CPBP intramembrane protease [Planctomycetota bacterium]